MQHWPSMARLLYITLGLSGGLNSSLELARRVRNQGHTVSFLGHRDVADRVEAHGFAYERLTADEDAIAALRAGVNKFRPLHSLALARNLRNRFIESDEIEQHVAELAPDALIIDVEAHYALIATRSSGLPTLTKSDFFSMAHQRGIPPLHSSQTKPATFIDRLRAERTWAKARAERLITKTIGELHPRRLSRRWTPFHYNTIARRDLTAVAAARGLSLNDISSQQGWLWPQTYPDLPLVSATPKEVDFVDQTSPNDSWVGPLVPESRPNPNLTDEAIARWHRFRAKNRERDRPLLYCSFGTILADTKEMLQTVLSAVSQHPEWDLVIGLGGRADQLIAAPVADNVLVLEVAPQLEVLTAADLAIIHGGINGILESLTFGVPMIVEQAGPVDGPGNTARVAHAGIGHAVAITELGASGLAALITETLNDETMRARTDQLAARVNSYRQDRVLENIVDRLLAEPI